MNLEQENMENCSFKETKLINHIFFISILFAKREWNKNDFINHQFISKGKYGIVYKCQEALSNKIVALKVIKKETVLQYNMLTQLRREAEIQNHLKFIYIIKFSNDFIKNLDILILFNYMGIFLTKLTSISLWNSLEKALYMTFLKKRGIFQRKKLHK